MLVIQTCGAHYNPASDGQIGACKDLFKSGEALVSNCQSAPEGPQRDACLKDANAQKAGLINQCWQKIGLVGVPPNQPTDPNKNAGKKTSIKSGKVQSTSTNAAKVKSGLDRFDLGPSFASPNSVGTGTKGARSDGKSGSATQKPSTTFAPGVQNQPAQTYSPGVQKQGP